jgi:hypothetical protein
MQPNEADEGFPVDVNSALINDLQKAIIWGVKLLAIMMTLVIFGELPMSPSSFTNNL